MTSGACSGVCDRMPLSMLSIAESWVGQNACALVEVDVGLDEDAPALAGPMGLARHSRTILSIHRGRS